MLIRPLRRVLRELDNLFEGGDGPADAGDARHHRARPSRWSQLLDLFAGAAPDLHGLHILEEIERHYSGEQSYREARPMPRRWRGDPIDQHPVLAAELRRLWLNDRLGLGAPDRPA